MGLTSRIYIKCTRPRAGAGAVRHSAHVHRKLFHGSPTVGQLPLLGMRGLPAEPSQSAQGGVVCRGSRSLASNQGVRFVGTTIPKMQSATLLPVSPLTLGFSQVFPASEEPREP